MPASSSAAAFAGVSAANSASASAAASRARDTECRIILRTYDAKAATQTEQVAYADCVYRFKPMDEAEVGAAKILVGGAIVLALVGGLVGAWRGLQDGMPILVAVMGALIALLVGAVGLMLFAAAGFLLS